ncbi:MAG: YdcF family protein [Leptolyngbya sp. SIO3F4]|nr:YdcF family protein [Leptolyngbya sp. SIO3F4]
MNKDGAKLESNQNPHQSIISNSKRNNLLRWFASTIVIVGLSPWWVNKALQVIVARPSPDASADAIVVLGRGPENTKYRTDAAIKLWNESKAPHIFISGILDAPVIIEKATSRGIPNTDISGESCSRSTWENAFYSEMLMPASITSTSQPKILLVTDDLHIARATLIFRSFGFEVIPHPVKTDFAMWRQHIFREFFVLLYYAKSGRLQTPTEEDYQWAKTDAKSRIPRRQCILAYTQQ